ncbi:MAG TPA: alpha-amylase family glycosyl hydrolase [Propionibacteriaceae bacterium]|nr:alpha-amylase family glycosyl hydrolase [Propionibacteriaceae bacterium]
MRASPTSSHIDDHRDVAPELGSLDDFDEMARTLHAAGIKVIVDIVPNHTSNRHPWFVQALAAGSGAPERDRYLFRDGLGRGGELPPNDWESLFGGSAWAPAGDGQWYLHLFAAEQPDLNWENEEVRADFGDTLHFWADRGVDGFGIDVAHGLRKDLSEPYPPWGEIADLMREDGSHPLWDRDDVHEIYADWRRIFNSYEPPRYAVAEADVHPGRRARYASADSLGNAFNFDMQDADWRADQYRRVINNGLADMINNGSTTSWLLGCHDLPRVATCWRCPARPTSTRATSWGSMRWLTYRRRSWRTRWPAARRRIRAGTGAGCRCRGPPMGFPTDSVLRARICRSRTGSAATRSASRRLIPTPRSIFTAKRSRSAASCLLAATSAGSSRSRMCWASSEPVAYGA